MNVEIVITKWIGGDSEILFNEIFEIQDPSNINREIRSILDDVSARFLDQRTDSNES